MTKEVGHEFFGAVSGDFANMGYEALARDEELLLAPRSGSHAVFAELQRTYSHRVYQRILSNNAESGGC
jgi:hypothetical protein